MSKPLPIGAECWVDIGYILIQGTIAKVHGEGIVFYDVEWQSADGKKTVSELIYCENVMTTLDQVHEYITRRLQYWDRKLEQIEAIPEEPDPEAIREEEQRAFEDAEADAAMRMERLER